MGRKTDRQTDRSIDRQLVRQIDRLAAVQAYRLTCKWIGGKQARKRDGKITIPSLSII